MPDDTTTTTDDVDDDVDTGPDDTGSGSQDDREPDLDGDFDAERAKKLIAKLRREARDHKAKVRELEPFAQQVHALEDASRTEQERAIAAAQAAEERARRDRHRAVRAEVKALAAEKFADPADAAVFLDLDGYVSDTDDDIDTDQIAADLAELLERKPHLARPADNSGPRAPARNPAQGANGGNPRPNQLDRDALKRMTPEQIVKAQKDGLLDNLLGVNK